MSRNKLEPGYSIRHIRCTLENSWKAAYGLELIRINREADRLSAELGYFVEAVYPTEEEFREARKLFSRRVTADGRARPNTLRISNLEGLLWPSRSKKGSKRG